MIGGLIFIRMTPIACPMIIGVEPIAYFVLITITYAPAVTMTITMDIMMAVLSVITGLIIECVCIAWNSNCKVPTDYYDCSVCYY